VQAGLVTIEAETLAGHGHIKEIRAATGVGVLLPDIVLTQATAMYKLVST